MSNPIPVAAGLQVRSQQVIDYRSCKVVDGVSYAYASDAEALTMIPVESRAEGVMVFVRNGSNIEFWQFQYVGTDLQLIKTNSSVPLRFGKSGEDETSTENRTFWVGTPYFLNLRSSNGGGITQDYWQDNIQLYLQAQNADSTTSAQIGLAFGYSAKMMAQNPIGNVSLSIDSNNTTVLPKILITGLPTGAGYILTDLVGDGSFTPQPAAAGSTPSLDVVTGVGNTSNQYIVVRNDNGVMVTQPDGGIAAALNLLVGAGVYGGSLSLKGVGSTFFVSINAPDSSVLTSTRTLTAPNDNGIIIVSIKYNGGSEIYADGNGMVDLGAIPDTNFANGDLVLTNNRFHNLLGYVLQWIGGDGSGVGQNTLIAQDVGGVSLEAKSGTGATHVMDTALNVLESNIYMQATNATGSCQFSIGTTSPSMLPVYLAQGLKNFNYPDDTAAQAAGIPVEGLYHNNGIVRIRLV